MDSTCNLKGFYQKSYQKIFKIKKVVMVLVTKNISGTPKHDRDRDDRSRNRDANGNQREAVDTQAKCQILFFFQFDTTF